MKTRVTFRIAQDLAEALRTLPNQTDFVEKTLRDALGAQCPVCQGSGRVSSAGLFVPNWREQGLPPLNRGSALQLKSLIGLARELGVTRLEVNALDEGFHVDLIRDELPLLSGHIDDTHTQLQWH